MKRFRTISLISIGFIAGIAFIISCGGGGSKVLAEITSVLGIEERLDNITNAVLGIDATTDTTGVESTISSLKTSINSIDTRLADIDTTLQDIDLNLSASASETVTINYVIDGVLPVTAGTWSGTSEPIDISGYRQARIFAIPQDFQVDLGANITAGSVSTGLVKIGTTSGVQTINILGDTMVVDVRNMAGAYQGASFSITVQLVK